MVDIRKLIDDFVVGDRRFGELNLEVFIRPSGRPSFDIIPGYVCIFDSSMGGDKVFQVHRAFQENENPSVLSPYSTQRLQERFILLQSLVQYFDTEGDPRWSLEFACQRMRQLRLDLKLHPVALARRLGISALELAAWESGRQSPGTAMYEWCRALDIFLPPKTALVRVIDISPELLRALKDNPDELRRLRPDQFEGFVANRLDRMGYNVTLTGNTNRKDGGIDIVATKALPVGSHVLAAQVKHHRDDQKTGVDAVQRLAYWKKPPFNAGLLVTNTAFTGDAIKAAAYSNHGNFFSLKDFDDLKGWLQDQYGSPEDWREIPDHIELAPGVMIEIPKPKLFAPDGSKFGDFEPSDD